MTATLSAAQIMGRGTKTRSRPDPHGPLGRMYDDLRAGMIVRPGPNAGARADQLRNFYGQVIERVGDGYRLVGEWEHGVFVTIERIYNPPCADTPNRVANH